MSRSERGGIVRFFGLTLLTFMVLGLIGLVGYLQSDINHRRYRLAVAHGHLRVERGLLLPLGFGTYEPDTPQLHDVYAPIPVPANESVTAVGPFEERSDLDRALFGILSNWARPRLDALDAATIDLASAYVKRLEALPGISEEQRLELRTLRANVAFRNGERLLEDVVNRLHHAQDEYRLALQLGTPRGAEAQRAIAEIDRRIALYREVAPKELPPP